MVRPNARSAGDRKFNRVRSVSPLAASCRTCMSCLPELKSLWRRNAGTPLEPRERLCESKRLLCRSAIPHCFDATIPHEIQFGRMILPDFQLAMTSSTPFPHVCVPAILTTEVADRILCWLKNSAPWTLRVESFYEQHEFSLLATNLESEVAELISPTFIEQVRQE